MKSPERKDGAMELLENIPLGTKIRRLYESRRESGRRGIGSLTWLCRRAGMASKGYLSDVMSGRRRLNQRYAEPLAEALGLSGVRVEIFKTLVELEHARGEEAESLRSKLEELRKSG